MEVHLVRRPVGQRIGLLSEDPRVLELDDNARVRCDRSVEPQAGAQQRSSLGARADDSTLPLASHPKLSGELERRVLTGGWRHEDRCGSQGDDGQTQILVRFIEGSRESADVAWFTPQQVNRHAAGNLSGAD